MQCMRSGNVLKKNMLKRRLEDKITQGGGKITSSRLFPHELISQWYAGNVAGP